jgi:hypothetical protein
LENGDEPAARELATSAIKADIKPSVTTSLGRSQVAAVGEQVAPRESSPARAKQESNKPAPGIRERVVASSLSKKEFINKLKEVGEGRFDEAFIYLRFQDGAFQATFGDPDSNVSVGEGKRLYKYRCNDGTLMLTLKNIGNYTLLFGVDQY